MTTSVSTFSSEIHACLKKAAAHFEDGDEVMGKLVFLSICREPHRDENAVYDQIARLQGLPSGSTQEGKLYFFDLDGKSMPSAQKAEAIRAHIRSLNLQRNQIPSLLAREEIEEATTESDWSGYKKAALVGVGLLSAGLVIGTGVYIYRQRGEKCDDEQEGAVDAPNKDLDDLIEKENALNENFSFPNENSGEKQPISEIPTNPVFSEETWSYPIRTGYYSPNLFDLSHTFRPDSPPPRISNSTLIVLPPQETVITSEDQEDRASINGLQESLVDSLSFSSNDMPIHFTRANQATPPRSQVISSFQEDGDSSRLFRFISLPGEVASQSPSLEGPADPEKYIAYQEKAGAPIDLQNSFPRVINRLITSDSYFKGPFYTGRDGRKYYEPQWPSINHVFGLMDPYKNEGKFIEITVELKEFEDKQMCTIFCLNKNEEQKNYEYTMNRLSWFPFLSRTYQNLSDMTAFIENQNRSVFNLKEELEQHLDEWNVDRVEVGSAKERLEKKGYQTDQACRGIEVIIFHKRV